MAMLHTRCRLSFDVYFIFHLFLIYLWMKIFKMDKLWNEKNVFIAFFQTNMHALAHPLTRKVLIWKMKWKKAKYEKAWFMLEISDNDECKTCVILYFLANIYSKQQMSALKWISFTWLDLYSRIIALIFLVIMNIEHCIINIFVYLLKTYERNRHKWNLNSVTTREWWQSKNNYRLLLWISS